MLGSWKFVHNLFVTSCQLMQCKWTLYSYMMTFFLDRYSVTEGPQKCTTDLYSVTEKIVKLLHGELHT